MINHTSTECYCGETYGSYGNATSQGKSCKIPCINNKNETCGGAYANSIYQIDSSSCVNSTSSAILSELFFFYSILCILLAFRRVNACEQ